MNKLTAILFVFFIGFYLHAEDLQYLQLTEEYNVTEDGLILYLQAVDIDQNAENPKRNYYIQTNFEFLNQIYESRLVRSYLSFDAGVTGSNTSRFFDGNSMFIFEDSEEDHENATEFLEILYSQYSHSEINNEIRNIYQLVDDYGTVFWQEYDSLLIIFVENFEAFSDELRSNESLMSAIQNLVRNPYEENSWYNVEGYALELDLEFNTSSRENYITEEAESGYQYFYEVNNIDYDSPSLYLEEGLRSELTPENREMLYNTIVEEVGEPIDSIEYLQQLGNWFWDYFDDYGINDYEATINDLVETRKFRACAEVSLIQASILRILGFPTVYVLSVDTENARWIYDRVRQGRWSSDRGMTLDHEMVEVFVNGEWVLMTDFSRVVLDYDYTNPYITIEGAPQDYFILAKGYDQWDVGIFNHEDRGEIQWGFIVSLVKGELDHFIENGTHHERIR